MSGVNQYPTAEVASRLQGNYKRPIRDLSIFTTDNVSRLEGRGN